MKSVINKKHINNSMATVKLRFRRSTVAGKEGTLYFRITHGRISRQVNTGLRIFADEWDGNTLKIPDADGQQERRSYLFSIEERIRKDTSRINETIRQMDLSGKEYTAAQVVDAFLSADSNGGELNEFVRVLAAGLKHIGKERLAETYTTTANSFMRFCVGRGDLRFNEISPELIREYEARLNEQGLVPNTTSFYMRNLRAIYNRAVEQGLTADRMPFKHVYTGIGKTVKRAVPPQVIRRIKNLDLSSDQVLQRSRDLFMFSFYTRGMPFVDMANLKKTDLRNGVLAYRRKKTGQQLYVKWEKPMQDIVDRYQDATSPYLLPIITTPGKGERRQYLNAIHLTNRHLRIIGDMAGSPIPLTTYVARHCWASIAKSRNIPIATISEAMGHDSESTTRIYLASLDASVVDDANSKVISSI